jgi:hypothetical protein
MDSNPNVAKVLRLSHYARVFLLVGVVAIYLQMAINLIFVLTRTIFDVVPATIIMDAETRLFYILIPGLGLPALAIFFASLRQSRKKMVTRWWSFSTGFWFLISTLAVNAALMFGGGWFVGTILADIGLCMLLRALKLAKQLPARSLDGLQAKEMLAPLLDKKHALGIVLTGIMFLSLVTPLLIRSTAIPAPLIPEAASKPVGIEPNHQNTFYIMPIWEWQGADYNYGIGQLAYMKAILGGDDYTGTGFVKIGRSVSCWYTSDLYENGSFNPTNLIHTLELHAMTQTPVLFHMNGGNWGGCCSQNPVVAAMRADPANCQWDQKDVCHPIKYNPGPNDRFWSFWPDSDWEHFRERNIKDALAIIHAWWLEHPDLLVGFSTDSEIHLNYNSFQDVNEGGYKSYFDYNPGTIAQYREWAQARWSLAEFNAKCKTNFNSWPEVDAPRTDDVVGKIGHPWWEMWTEFRIWHVQEAGRRQSRWINEMGFPREMIWNHQIFSEPDSQTARYQRCDPLETAVNEYCKVGVTRYGWIGPEAWHSLGELALNDGSGDTIPSWGIFEWNLWQQHEYWAYREMLNCIYQYGGHVICPNEWANCSINEGLWIPGGSCQQGEPYEINGTIYGSDETGCIGTPGNCCCVKWNGTQCLQCVDRHGNPQFLAALHDFIAIGQDYERGTCPDLRIDTWDLLFYDQYLWTYEYFSDDTGLYFMGGLWLICILYLLVTPIRKRRRRQDAE